VLHSKFGCCIGTITKSLAYEISGAPECRAVPIRELVEAGSLPTQVSLGSGDTDIFAYDANTLRISQYQFKINGLICPLAPRTES